MKELLMKALDEGLSEPLAEWVRLQFRTSRVILGTPTTTTTTHTQGGSGERRDGRI